MPCTNVPNQVRIGNVDDSAVAAALSCNTCTSKRASSCEGFAIAMCQVFTSLSGLCLSGYVSLHQCQLIQTIVAALLHPQGRQWTCKQEELKWQTSTVLSFWIRVASSSQSVGYLDVQNSLSDFFSIQVVQTRIQNQSWQAFLRCRPCS